MKKIFILTITISLIIIQCNSKTKENIDNNNNSTNEIVKSNETIPATKILSQADAAFVDTV